MNAPRRLFFYNAGLLRQARVRRMLELAGHDLRIGLPQQGDGVVVWGRSPYAARGEAIARRRNTPLLRIEDAFLRSVHPGRANGGGPLGIFLDSGVHFDASAPTAIETALNAAPDPALLQRARDGIARLRALDLSKYNDFDPYTPLPEAGFVLVVDQVHGDASLPPDAARIFAHMLATARAENPDLPVIVKTHPETAAGLREGHLPTGITGGSPWALLDRAARVYTVSSQLGFEAILAEHAGADG